MTELGSGIALDGSFDLAVSSSGDLQHTEDFNELSKDLSLVVAEVLTTGSVERLPEVYESITIPESLQQQIGDVDTDNDGQAELNDVVTESGGIVGRYMDEGLARDVEILVANLISLDPRIGGVRRVEAQQDSADPDQIEISVRATIADLGTEANLEFIVPVAS